MHPHKVQPLTTITKHYISITDVAYKNLPTYITMNTFMHWLPPPPPNSHPLDFALTTHNFYSI